MGSGCWLTRLRCLLGLVVLLEWFSLVGFGFEVFYWIGSVGVILGWVYGVLFVVFDCDFMVVLLLLFAL